MRGSQLSKPSTHAVSIVPFEQVLPRCPPFVIENSELEPIIRSLQQAHTEVLEARARTKELREVIEDRQQVLRQLEDLHQVNQQVITRHEKELSAQRNGKTYYEVVKQKETAGTSLQTVFEKVKKMTQSHCESLRELQAEELPEGHENKVVGLMLAQMKLYRGQILQRQMDSEQAITRHSRQLQLISDECQGLSREKKEANSARLSDMKRILKLLRTEAYTAKTIRSHGLNPTDEVAAEATVEVMVRLKEKLAPMDENTEFLRSLEEKLKRRGVNLQLEKAAKEELVS